MELPFAAIQQLCSPNLDLVEHLPEPQREAFEVALGLRAGHPPSPYLVGLAVLNLLSDAAEERPLLCVVDDAQWLDRSSARVLSFVARRLLAEKIVMLFAARGPIDALDGVAEVGVDRWGIEMRGRCSTRSCRRESTSASWSGLSSRQAATRSPSSNFRAA